MIKKKVYSDILSLNISAWVYFYCVVYTGHGNQFEKNIKKCLRGFRVPQSQNIVISELFKHSLLLE